MNSAASGMASRSSSSSERPSLNSMTMRGRSTAGNSTSAKRTSEHVSGRGGRESDVDIPPKLAGQRESGRGVDFGTFTRKPRRPDLVCFVNGLPRGLIELENPADQQADVWKAFSQLWTTG
jgi:hypothetical protein